MKLPFVLGALAVAGLAVLGGERRAFAQVHWDAQLGASLATRFPEGLNAAAGPGLVAAGHVAVLPLLRAGPYLSAELAPPDDAPSRWIVGGGLRAKLMAPWPAAPFRGWIFAGVGAAWLVAPAITPPTSSSAQGVFGEVPLGVGLGYRLRRPWELYAELGAKIGFAFAGSYFDEGKSNAALVRQASAGEPVGLSLTLGMTFDG